MASVLLLCTILSLLLIPDTNGIAGGVESTDDKRPYHASLQLNINSNITHFCGASIISTKFLLTAASCDPGSNVTFCYARVGAIAYTNGGQVVKVASFMLHPDFNRETFEYDFAVVSLNPGVQINLVDPTVKIINMSRSIPEDRERITASGWGAIRNGSTEMMINFREADLPTWFQIECTRVYPFLKDTQICAGGCAGGIFGTCLGDIGGPAEYNGTLVGVTTPLYGCEARKVPTVFGRVSAVMDWVNEIIEE